MCSEDVQDISVKRLVVFIGVRFFDPACAGSAIRLVAAARCSKYLRARFLFDIRYCIALHCIGWHCHRIALYCIVLYRIYIRTPCANVCPSVA